MLTVKASRGSPPRVRGEVQVRIQLGRPHRITPACAGRSLCAVPHIPAQKDHPRVCGEKPSTSSFSPAVTGSPPRVRGEVARIHKADGARGITPACAGRSPWAVQRGCRAPDHPRVCGEKSLGDVPRAQIIGSPPRVRGEVAIIMSVAKTRGITPACAGRRSVRARAARQPPDHPRVCGEKFIWTQALLSRLGSPPRVRGEARAARQPPLKKGITPACAGRSVSV